MKSCIIDNDAIKKKCGEKAIKSSNASHKTVDDDVIEAFRGLNGRKFDFLYQAERVGAYEEQQLRSVSSTTRAGGNNNLIKKLLSDIMRLSEVFISTLQL